jgi:hypothetical protein
MNVLSDLDQLVQQYFVVKMERKAPKPSKKLKRGFKKFGVIGDSMKLDPVPEQRPKYYENPVKLKNVWPRKQQVNKHLS